MLNYPHYIKHITYHIFILKPDYFQTDVLQITLLSFIHITFVIGSSYIRKSEDAKLVSLAEWLKANPDFSVVVVGYADKETGSSKGNLALSQKRASAVAARLVKLGVDESRVSTDFKGDTVQPYEVNDQNRVVVCTVE